MFASSAKVTTPRLATPVEKVLYTPPLLKNQINTVVMSLPGLHKRPFIYTGAVVILNYTIFTIMILLNLSVTQSGLVRTTVVVIYPLPAHLAGQLSISFGLNPSQQSRITESSCSLPLLLASQ